MCCHINLHVKKNGHVKGQWLTIFVHFSIIIGQINYFFKESFYGKKKIIVNHYLKGIC